MYEAGRAFVGFFFFVGGFFLVDYDYTLIPCVRQLGFFFFFPLREIRFTSAGIVG